MTAIPRHAIVERDEPGHLQVVGARSGGARARSRAARRAAQSTAASTQPSTGNPPISTTGSASATTTAPVIVGIRLFGTGRGVEKTPATT